MVYFIFIITFLAACFCIIRVPFIKKSGLKSHTILALFILKIIAGILAGYISSAFGETGDNWVVNEWSVMEFELLKNDPLQFFKELVVSNYNGEGYDNFFGSSRSFWNDLDVNILGKSLAPFNLISNGNYYINSIFYNFLGFFGHIALFRIFLHIYPSKKTAILAGCFLLPAFMYATSTIGKDNLTFVMLAFCCFCIYFFTLSGFNLRRTLWLLFFFCGLFFLRNYVAVLFIAPAIAFYICHRFKKNPYIVFAATFCLLIVFLLIIPAILPSVNPAKIIYQKQQEFLALGIANSQIETVPLEANTMSLIENLPRAVVNGYFRPWIFEAKKIFSIFLSIENGVYIIIYMIALMYVFKYKKFQHPVPFIILCILFTALVSIVNGYIVPNFNALVRYRSIYLPLIIIPALACFPFNIKFKNM